MEAPILRFAFHLAELSGAMHPNRLNLSPKEIMECLAYHNLITLSERRHDRRAAMLALVANRAMGGKLKWGDVYPAEAVDRRHRTAQSVADMKEALSTWGGRGSQGRSR